MEEYSTFSKAPKLEPHHDKVYCHIQDTHWVVLLICREVIDIFYSPCSPQPQLIGLIGVQLSLIAMCILMKLYSLCTRNRWKVYRLTKILCGIWPKQGLFFNSAPSSPQTSFISVAELGSLQSKKSSTADMTSANELFSPPCVYTCMNKYMQEQRTASLSMNFTHKSHCLNIIQWKFQIKTNNYQAIDRVPPCACVYLIYDKNKWKSG